MDIAQPITPRLKLVMDWGYRHGLMLTRSQAEDILYTLDPATPKSYSIAIGQGRKVPLSMGQPTGKYAGQPEHAQRGWKPE